MTGPMVTWVPGHRDCTASAMTCAQSCRISSNAPRVFAGQELDLGVAFDRVAEVGDHAIKRHRHRALGKRGGNALGDVEPADAGRVVASGAVGEGQFD